MIKGALDKAKQKSMAKSQEEAYKSQQLAENEIDNTKQNLEQTRQNNLNNMQQQMQQPQSNEELVKDLMGQYENQGQSVPESSGQLAEGMPTGFASNIPTNNYLEENAPSLPYVGSATEALDEQSAMKQSIMDKLKSLGGAVSNGIRDFSTGYDDNSQHGFADGDLFKGLTNNEVKPSVTDEGVVTGGASELKKSIMNRLGELAGTGARVMANPWTQAGIAALATKATGGDWADSLNNAYSYGTAKATSNYYDNKLNPGEAPKALSRYTKDDYNAHTLAGYRDDQAKIGWDRNRIDEDYKKGRNAIDKAYKEKRLDLDEKKINIDQQKANETASYHKGLLANGQARNQIYAQSVQQKIDQINASKEEKAEMNSNFGKYMALLERPVDEPGLFGKKVGYTQEQKNADIAKARRGLVSAYGKDFLSILDDLEFDDEDI